MRVVTVLRHPAGGERTYLKYTYNHLNGSTYQFTVLTVSAEEIDQLKRDLARLSPEFVETRAFGVAFVVRLVTLLFRRDVCLIHSHGYACAILVSFLNLFFRVPHVTTFHGTFDATSFQGRFGRLQKRFILAMLARADFINLVSEDAKQNLIEHFPGIRKHLAKLVVIENGIDVDFFRGELPDRRRIADIDGINEDTFVVGYLGRYMPEKGFEVLIDAVDQIARSGESVENIRVLALGWGSYIREYQARIRERDLERFFVFIDFQPDVRWILRQVSVLAIPSLREAFPLVAIEGLVSGTPMVASDCVGLREALRDTPTRMVPAGNASALARAILEKRRDPRRRESIDFIPEAAQRFDVRASSARLSSLFERAQQARS